MGKKIIFDFGGKKTAKKNLGKGLALGAAAGTALGALTGLLFAPKSGKETRKDISDGVSTTAKKVVEEVKTNSAKLGEKIEGVVIEGKNKLFKKSSCCCNSECDSESETSECAATDEKIEE